MTKTRQTVYNTMKYNNKTNKPIKAKMQLYLVINAITTNTASPR